LVAISAVIIFSWARLGAAGCGNLRAWLADKEVL
jgi:hypothetical protein